MSAEELADLESEQPSVHCPGEMVWVALRGFPLWPSIVVHEKQSGLHTKMDGEHVCVLGLWSTLVVRPAHKDATFFLHHCSTEHRSPPSLTTCQLMITSL